MNAGEALRYEVLDTLPEDAAGVVDEGIGAFNQSAAPLGDVVPLSSFARASDGRVVGGAVGRTWGECCELQQFWVHEIYRRRGIGAALMDRFEARAAQRGCRLVYLDTFSFQALAFYRARGYRVVHEIRGFAGGIVKYAMQRDLVPLSRESLTQ